MSIRWIQKEWYTVKGERKCRLWEGTRTDGRTFYVRQIKGVGYVVRPFNGGMDLGIGTTLAVAQKIAENAPGVKLAKKAVDNTVAV